ncbi:MAG: ABC transporter permease [Acidobacteria bacterium]|nr:ABC transporter permease [Acidobacteriota bacterium]
MGGLDSLRSDVRYAFRTLRRDRSFTLGAILVLALGIGANTAVYSLVDNILLRPLSYHEPDRLYVVQEVVPQLSHLYPLLPVNGRHFLEWRKRCSSFEDVALIDGAELNLTGGAEPERIRAARVTANYFSLLGIQTQSGRSFLPEDGQSGHERVVILSDSLWRRRFAADPSLLGKTVALNGASHVVVGILPAWFRPPAWRLMGRAITDRVEIFQPWAVKEDDWGWLGDFNYAAIARLRKDVSRDGALAELNVVQSRIAAGVSGSERFDLRAQLFPLQDQVVERARGGLLLLLGAVGAVLLIACVNLGNLMLVRATARAREAAIRTALGAPRWRIFRGLLVESLVLALAGAAAGLALAVALVHLVVATSPVDLPRFAEVRVDWRALIFALALAVTSGALFGMLPAWRLTRADPQEAIRLGGRSSTDGGGRLRLRELLVGIEVGLSATLLIVAGLLVNSFVRLNGVTRGFDVRNILTAEVRLPAPRYEAAEKRQQFVRELLAKLENQPGVLAAGVISVLPLSGEAWTDVVSTEGDTRPIIQRPIADYRPITPDYLRAMGIALRSGRAITEADRPRKTVVVSERLAQRVWPGELPIGKTFRRGNPKQPPYEVVGVAADIRGKDLQQEPGPMVYVPYWDRTPSNVSIAVRTALDPLAAAGALRRAVWSLDSELPLSGVRSMEQIERTSLAGRRFQMLLIAVFATSALLLAALGLYAVLAFSVARRTNEMGIRMALGAQRADLIWMVLRHGLAPVAVGLAAGVGGALALGRLLSSFLFGVGPSDAKTIQGVVAVTLAAALLACWLPARRAARVDPMVALRFE